MPYFRQVSIAALWTTMNCTIWLFSNHLFSNQTAYAYGPYILSDLKQELIYHHKSQQKWEKIINAYKLYFFCYFPLPNCKIGLDGGLNSVFGHVFTNNFSKIKTGEKLVFIWLLVLWLYKVLLCFILVRYKFEQVMISRNYFS